MKTFSIFITRNQSTDFCKTFIDWTAVFPLANQKAWFIFVFGGIFDISTFCSKRGQENQKCWKLSALQKTKNTIICFSTIKSIRWFISLFKKELIYVYTIWISNLKTEEMKIFSTPLVHCHKIISWHTCLYHHLPETSSHHTSFNCYWTHIVCILSINWDYYNTRPANF